MRSQLAIEAKRQVHEYQHITSSRQPARALQHTGIQASPGVADVELLLRLLLAGRLAARFAARLADTRCCVASCVLLRV